MITSREWKPDPAGGTWLLWCQSVTSHAWQSFHCVQKRLWMAYTDMAIPTWCLNDDLASSSCPVLELKRLDLSTYSVRFYPTLRLKFLTALQMAFWCLVSSWFYVSWKDLLKDLLFISDQSAHPSSPEEITNEFMAISPPLFIYTHESCFHREGEILGFKLVSPACSLYQKSFLKALS